MFYFVFARTKKANGSFKDFMGYAGIHKSNAVKLFEDLVDRYCSVNAMPQIAYLVGFDSGLAFLQEALKKLPDIGESFSSDIPMQSNSAAGSLGSDSTNGSNETSIQQMLNAFIPELLSNIESAVFVNTLSTSGYNHGLVQNCEECNCVDGFAKKNIYGKQLCATCMAKYMSTREGLAEYFIGIADGNYNTKNFIEEDFAAMANAWYLPEVDDGHAKSNKELLIEAYTAKGMSEEAIAALIRAAEEGFELRTGYIIE